MSGTRRPLVFAHRGSSAAAAEHTLGAYLLAIEEGADGLECDVRLTRDGHLVCLHDRRLNRTSDGRGVVSRHTLDELNRYDFASWHPGRPDLTGDLIRDHARVLTLDRLLAAARDAGRPLEVLVETKHPTRYGRSVEHALLATLHRHGLDRPDPDSLVRVTVMSFSVLAIRRIHEIAPGLPTTLLLEYVPPGLRHGGLPFGTPIGGPSVRLLRSHPHLVHRLRQRGRRVYVWTVNEPDDLDLVVSLGVDGIISDRPAEMLARLERCWPVPR